MWLSYWNTCDQEWLGYAGAGLTTLSFVPQALKSLLSRNTQGISLLMYTVFVLGLCFWLAYGFVLQSVPVIVANIITLLLAGLILALKLINVIRNHEQP
ncbi:MAG: SemiSWEET transporter [Flavobacteriales bacterium]|nr:SemiSWEET transporter [Flavobacteriales bacterium]